MLPHRRAYTLFFNKFRVVGKFILNGVVLFFVLSLVTQLPVVNKYMPVQPIYIVSESMEPVIMTGAIVVGHKDFDKDSLLVGDIIAYDVYINGSKLLVVHRITDISNGIYSTKGDNNQYHDNWDVDFESIQYRIDGVFNQTSFTAKYGIMKTAILALIPMVGIGYLAMNIHSKLIMDKDELDLEDN